MSREELQKKLNELGLKDVEILEDATNKFNCGGHVFLKKEQRGLIVGIKLKDLMKRLGYTPIEEGSKAKLEDLVAYDGSPHIGFVKEPDRHGEIWVESKWGSWGVLKHKIDDVPEDFGVGTVYRTSRAGGRFLSPVDGD
jgi:hypothetical protein